MKVLKHILLAVSFCLLTGTMSFAAVELRGTASVSITSDTSANAKNMAFDEARRQIISDSLRQYVDVSAFSGLLKNSKSVELMNLISASSIDGEQVSDTTYSANISMTLDNDAVRNWLVNNNVQNWLPDNEAQDMFAIFVSMSNPMLNWGELNAIARSEKIDLGTKYLSANSATLSLPVSVRGAFTIAIREAGWRYANQDGNLRIWK